MQAAKPMSRPCGCSGHEAAFYWTLTIHGMRISIISVMTFDDEAKIASMKAYWGPENISQV